jgi:hypothetical protein
MAHLFLSYAREDRECAELLANALTDRGWTVWWDRQLQVGRSFSQVIEQELDRARCVIVLWSSNAVTSEWVQNEASEAMRRKVLVPVRIEDVRPPLEFRRLHTADLLDWRRGFDSPEFDHCVASIELLVRKTVPGGIPNPVLDPPKEPEKQTPVESRRTDLWINQDGQQFRAPDLATLRRWAEEGRVGATSQVFDPKLQVWLQARQHPALESAYPPRPVVAQPPPETPPLPPDTVPEPGPRRAGTVRPAAVAAGVGILLLVLAIIIASVVANRRSGPYTPDTMATEMQAVLSTTAPDTIASPTSPLISLYVRNACSAGPIYVAICYLNANNIWIAKGWLQVGPNETQPALFQISGPTVYVYAQTAGRELIWQGSEKDQKLPIHMSQPFDGPVESLTGAGFLPVPYLAKPIDPSQAIHTETFTCN